MTAISRASSTVSWVLSTLLLLIGDHAAATAPTKPKIQLITSLIWSGMPIRESNLQALNRLRSMFATMPFHHFISPVYMLAAETERSTALKQIQAHSRDFDRNGLYLYPSYKLTHAAGAIFRRKPAFFDTYIADCDKQPICGYDTPLSIYEDYEVLALFRLGSDLLQSSIKTISPIFMTGVWDSSHHIRKTAALLGYKFDFSPISPDLVADYAAYYPGYSWLKTNWNHHFEQITQPYFYQDVKPSKLIAVPQNGGVIDYTSAEKTMQRFRRHLDLSQREVSHQQFFQIVVHLETLAQNEAKFAKLVNSMLTLAEEKGVTLSYYPAERDGDQEPK